jgi:dienelactone hydrolase
MAVILPNVRGSTGYGKQFEALDNEYHREDAVKDIGALLEWIAKQSDLDKERVVIRGSSYGGEMLCSFRHIGEFLFSVRDIALIEYRNKVKM